MTLLGASTNARSIHFCHTAVQLLLFTGKKASFDCSLSCDVTQNIVCMLVCWLCCLCAGVLANWCRIHVISLRNNLPMKIIHLTYRNLHARMENVPFVGNGAFHVPPCCRESRCKVELGAMLKVVILFAPWQRLSFVSRSGTVFWSSSGVVGRVHFANLQ